MPLCVFQSMSSAVKRYDDIVSSFVIKMVSLRISAPLANSPDGTFEAAHFYV